MQQDHACMLIKESLHVLMACLSYSYRSGETTSNRIRQHCQLVLPSDSFDRVRVVGRRSKILHDTLHLLKNGLDVTKHIRVTFVNEYAVDQGRPLREYYRLLLTAVASSNTLFSGPDSSRTPTHHVVEFERMTFYYVGVTSRSFMEVQHPSFSLLQLQMKCLIHLSFVTHLMEVTIKGHSNAMASLSSKN